MMLEVSNIETAYDQVKVLKEVSLEVKKGEVVTLIGSNGAGKTTLINTISGIVKPLKGEIIFEGQKITKVSPDKITNRGICQVPEGRPVFVNYSVQQNLKMGSYPVYRRLSKEEQQKDFDFVFNLFPELKQRLRQRANSLSGGQQQMLAIGMALMSHPQLLLLDEPSLGLAPLLVDKIFETLGILKSQGLTILLVEQNANLALSFGNRGYVLDLGKVVLSGSCQELRESERVKEYYLGMIKESKK
jgi:branched-chain amino acid transport system ATP-binding protein